MAAIKPIEQAADKWTRRASVAGKDYTDGVSAPRQSWQAAAAAADTNYRQGVTAAANAGRYGSGVRRAGDDKWRRGATTKGATRFAEGVQLAQADWVAGFQPYAQAISAVTLPARGPTGSPANFQRVVAVGTALRTLKERSSAGTR